MKTGARKTKVKTRQERQALIQKYLKFQMSFANFLQNKVLFDLFPNITPKTREILLIHVFRSRATPTCGASADPFLTVIPRASHQRLLKI